MQGTPSKLLQTHLINDTPPHFNFNITQPPTTQMKTKRIIQRLEIPAIYKECKSITFLIFPAKISEKLEETFQEKFQQKNSENNQEKNLEKKKL